MILMVKHAVEPQNLEGQVLPAEGSWLRLVAASVPAALAIVELGSYSGKSTCCLAVGSAEGNGARVYAVDLWMTSTFDVETRRFSEYKVGSEEPQHHCKFSRQPALDRFNERRARYDPLGLIRPITGETTKVAEVFGEPIGLLFIDADHLFEAVREDFQAWAPKVAPGGIVAFHDYKVLTRGEGVKRFVDESVRSDPHWQFLAWEGSLFAVRRI